VSDELHALAADRRAPNRELHPFNEFYGHDVVLKRYAGLVERRSLKAAVEHGFVFDDVVSEIDRRIGLPVYLCQSPRRARVVGAALPDAVVVPIGPLVRYVESRDRPPPGRRLVLFPAHSTHSVSTRYDVDDLLDRTVDRRRGFEETVVCLYWRDVLRGVAEEYEARGLRCVTAGHMYDDAFLPRLVEILEGAAAVVSNEPGTHVAYAVSLDRPVWLVDQPVGYAADTAAAAQRAALADPAAGALRRELLALFAEPSDRLADEQRRVVGELVGDAFVRSPDELREILLEAERRYASLPLRRRAALTARLAVRRVRGRGFRGAS
jgi:hypothetical protein